MVVVELVFSFELGFTKERRRGRKKKKKTEKQVLCKKGTLERDKSMLELFVEIALVEYLNILELPLSMLTKNIFFPFHIIYLLTKVNFK